MGSSLPGGGEADWPGYWLLSDMEADTGASVGFCVQVRLVQGDACIS